MHTLVKLILLFFCITFSTVLFAQLPDAATGLNIRVADSVARMNSRPSAAVQLKNNVPFFAGQQSKNNTITQNQFFGRMENSTAGSCLDTSARFFLKKDSVNLYIGNFIKCSDGNLLLSGEHYDYHGLNYIGKGLLMKCDSYGNVLWAKTYDSSIHIVNGDIYYYKLIELQDGSILMAGGINNRITSNRDLILTKTTSTGTVVWSKIYKSRLWTNGSGSADYFYVQQMKQDAAGDIYVTGPNWTAGRNVIKFSSINGSIAWSKLYQPSFGSYFDNPFGIDVSSSNVIRSMGGFITSYNQYISGYSISKATGDTVSTRFLTVSDTPHAALGFLSRNSFTKLNNGNLAISGNLFGNYMYTGGPTNLYQAGVAELDTNFNFIKAYCFRNSTASNSYNTRTTVYPDGSGIFTMLQVFSGYSANGYYVQFKNGVIQKNRKKLYVGEGFPNENDMLRLPDGGDLSIKIAGDSITSTSAIEFLKLHITDTSSACLGIDDTETFIQPYHFATVPVGLDSIGSNVFLENPNKTIVAADVVINELLPACQQTSICDSFSLAASIDTVCASAPLLITAHKNKLCGSRVLFNYDSTHVQSFLQINDSTYSISFNAAWQGYIYASLSGCTILTDSLFVSALFAPATIALGADSSICAGNSILLNAHSGFASYQWQDGSVDSVFTVTQPGQYYVTAVTACGGVLTDTINILPHAPVFVDAGPDRAKCNTDTIQINVAPGFINYYWSPNYNISSNNSASVNVAPVVDTAYFLKAEKTPGCFAFDTVRITVHHSLPVNLGKDTSICTGHSIVLNAGTGFVNYSWNNGQAGMQISVNTAGMYIVTCTDANTCNTIDTFNVVTLYQLPVVKLDHNADLCAGTSRVLDAGSFASYRWHDGSINRFFSTQTTGTYYVEVTDNNGCKGSDTAKIISLVPKIKNFLPLDTSICVYETMKLQSNKNFSTYLWNNNSIAPAIAVTQPGTYWLQVTDNKNCAGLDSIVVSLKQCLKGLFVPTAFSPNGDSKNDKLKALLFGDIKKFEFHVYNRYGQLIFRTKDVNEGWDGNISSVMQNSGSYVWICKYQLAGEPEKVEHGIFTLIK